MLSPRRKSKKSYITRARTVADVMALALPLGKRVEDGFSV
jgi:hypothetical protein